MITRVLFLFPLLAALIGLVPATALAQPVTPVVGTVTSVSPPASPVARADLPTVALSSLPAQAADTVALIERGGPYPYDRDGIVFDDREGILPDQASGYYHEYTVPTPGSDDRGVRRIVTGSSGEYYYTGDHYASFVVVDVSR